MAIEYYSTDDDLIKIRPNILQLGVSDWEEQSKEAFSIINRSIVSKWYKEVAMEYDVEWRKEVFDPDKVDETQLVRLSCYKILELAYLHLMKDTPEPDGFERQMKLFQGLYATEFNNVLASGINYDWDASDTIEWDEKLMPRQRRLKRA
jgi:hypothetical protein